MDGPDQVLSVPQGTGAGAVFRLRGRGLPDVHSGRKGDLRVVIDLKVPNDLNSHQRGLLEELARSFGPADDAGEENRDDDGNDKGLFERIKGAFG